MSFVNISFFSILFFFFNDTATTEIYTLSLHDALPIYGHGRGSRTHPDGPDRHEHRSEEHTSELQSRFDLVCRLLLEKKKNNIYRASANNINTLKISLTPKILIN